jgi:hypothetical protein
MSSSLNSMITFSVSLDAMLKDTIDEQVNEHLARTLTEWSAGELRLDDMVMESVDTALRYLYYYVHIPSGGRYSHNFVTSEWKMVALSR